MQALRNAAIIALLALALTVLPAGGNLATALLTALSLAFLAAIGLLAVRAWRDAGLFRDSLTDRRRALLYGALGAIALMIAGTDELLATGPGTVLWAAILFASGWLIYTIWREAKTL